MFCVALTNEGSPAHALVRMNRAMFHILVTQGHFQTRVSCVYTKRGSVRIRFELGRAFFQFCLLIDRLLRVVISGVVAQDKVSRTVRVTSSPHLHVHLQLLATRTENRTPIKLPLLYRDNLSSNANVMGNK